MTDMYPVRRPSPAGNAAPAQGEVVTPVDMIYIFYERSGLDDHLMAYVKSGENNPVEDVYAAITRYAHDVAGIADEGGDIDIGLIREAFDRFYEGMEGAAREKYGPEKPRTIAGHALTKLGLRQPTYRQQFSHLNDKYWNEQFMRQYEDQTIVRRDPDESDHEYLERYIAACMHGFPWSYFTNFI